MKAYTTETPLNFDGVFNPLISLQTQDVVEYIGNSSKDVFIPMGGDFQYIDALSNFAFMDDLIMHMNALTKRHGLFFSYSTPFCYLRALQQFNKEELLAIDHRAGDFLPYVSSKLSAIGPEESIRDFLLYIEGDKSWTGFFTSRPSLKRLIRYSNSMLQIVKQVDALFKYCINLCVTSRNVDMMAIIVAQLRLTTWIFLRKTWPLHSIMTPLLGHKSTK